MNLFEFIICSIFRLKKIFITKIHFFVIFHKFFIFLHLFFRFFFENPIFLHKKFKIFNFYYNFDKIKIDKKKPAEQFIKLSGENLNNTRRFSDNLMTRRINKLWSTDKMIGKIKNSPDF